MLIMATLTQKCGIMFRLQGHRCTHMKGPVFPLLVILDLSLYLTDVVGKKALSFQFLSEVYQVN